MKQPTYLCHFLISILFSSCAFMGGEIPDYPLSEFKTFTYKWYGTMPAYTQLQGNSPCYGIRNPCSENFEAYIKYTSLPYGRINVTYYINDQTVRTFEVYSDYFGSSSDNPLSWQSITLYDEYDNRIWYMINYSHSYYRLPMGGGVNHLFPFSFDQLPEFKTGVWNLFLPA